MFESKYSNVLTVILVIIIVAIIGLLCVLGFNMYQNYFIKKDAASWVENQQENEKEVENETQENNTANNEVVENPLNQIDNTTSTEQGTTSRKTYKGFVTLGTMEIPKIDFTYPVLEKASPSAIEVAVARLYPTTGELNEPGNVVIIGHNYRNGLFFSNNKKLNNGDKIYITDNSGKKVTYTIYHKFETTDTDTSFYQRDTNGKAEITLSTCTDDSKARLIILARED